MLLKLNKERVYFACHFIDIYFNNNFKELFECLVERNYDFNTIDHFGRTFIYYLTCIEDILMVLDSNINLNVNNRDCDGLTLLTHFKKT